VAATPAAAFGSADAPAKWVVSPYLDGEQIFDEADRLCPTHPVYVVPPERVDEIQEYFLNKEGF
jgi:protein farnesyltransferase subunit beta